MDIEFCCCFCCYFKFNNLASILRWSHRAIDNFFPSLVAVAVPLLLFDVGFSFFSAAAAALVASTRKYGYANHKNCAHRNQPPTGPNEFIGMVRKIKLVLDSKEYERVRASE